MRSFGVLVLALVGCRGAAPSSPSQAPPAPVASVSPAAPVATTVTASAPIDPIQRHNMQPKLRLGHYSSADGRVGLVLDRLGAKPRYRIDGSSAIVQLTPRPAPSGDVELVTSIERAVFRLGAKGEVTYFEGLGALALVRDADADPLSPVPPVASSRSDVGTEGKHLTTPLLRLGHYSSGDGMFGFVLDRTVAKPKLRVDGSGDVLVLDTVTSPSGGMDLVKSVRGTVVRIGERGDVTYFEAARGQPLLMMRDADAEPL